MLLRSLRWVLFFSLLGFLLFGRDFSLAQQEQRYFYDPLGRLIGEVNPQGFFDYAFNMGGKPPQRQDHLPEG
ncbi:MAG: hypothetical protein WAO55_14950 [Candidatus Manganitrophaceae bacterium]